jgi:BASS family bile acid:Na+ symporter
MGDLLIQIANWVVPIFIFATIANVGLTQNATRILGYRREWKFMIKMVLANFVAAPLLMYILLQIWPLEPALAAGLAVFSICAEAPFLIKLVATSEDDLALGAPTLIVLVLATIVVVPVLLPVVVPSAKVDAGAMATTLARQLLLPLIGGALLARFAPKLAAQGQPSVARIGNIALYVVLISTILGHLPSMMPIIRSGALVLGLVFILGAFGIGYFAGRGQDSLEDVGGLATAQRNAAAAMIIAVNSFKDPQVFVLVNLANAIGIAVLLAIASGLKLDNVRIQPI